MLYKHIYIKTQSNGGIIRAYTYIWKAQNACILLKSLELVLKFCQHIYNVVAT